MNKISKRLRYYLQIFPLIKNVSNWQNIFKIYFNPKDSVVINLRNGINFKINHYLDALTVKEIFIDQDYRPKLKEPKVIVDIGANIGTFTIREALEYPKAKIFSFEPAPKTHQLLAANLKYNNIHNVIARKLGVSSEEGKASFYVHPATGLSSLVKTRPGMKKVTISLTTLPKIFEENSIKKVDLLKMDCEGAEYEIIFTLPNKFFKKIPYIVMEYHDSITPHKHPQLVKFLKTKGYKVTWKRHPLETDIGIIHARLNTNA